MKLVDALRARFRSDPMLYTAFAALWICALVPLWGSRYLPLLDLPNHIDAIAIWHRYHDPSWKYSDYYLLNLKPVPYWGYFLPVHLMAYLMPLEVANKIYLSAYALALPVGAALLAVRMGRSPYLALFTFPLIFNMSFMFGFITFCAGMAVLPYAIVALDAFLEAPTRLRAFGVFALTMAVYFTHVLPWLYFGVAAGVLLFCHGFHPRRMLAAAALMLPSVWVAIIGFRHAADGTTAVKSGEVQFEAKWEKVLGLLSEIPSRLLTGWQSDEKMYVMLIVLALAWLFVALSGKTDVEGERRHGFRYRLEILFLIAVLAIFKLPAYWKKPVDLWMVGGRFVAVSAFFAAILPHGPIVGRRKWLLVPVVAACVWYPLMLHKHWRRFDRRAQSFRRLMNHVPRGSSTLTLVLGETNDPDADPAAVAYLQFHSYAQFIAGGYNPWALSTGFPMIPKPEKKLPSPAWKVPHSFRIDDHGVYYDFVLTKGEVADYSMFGPDGAGRAPMLGKDGDWRLYKMRAKP